MLLILNAVIGALVGVLINYLADVLPISRRFSRPLCLNCGKIYSIKDYLFSFRCSKCGNKTSPRVIIVFVMTILCCILLAFFPLDGLSFWATLPVLVFLGVILVIDIEYRVVLTETSYIGLVLFFIYGIFMHDFLTTIIGGVAGFLIMLLLYYFGILFNKIIGKIRKQEIEEVALGFGDVYVCGFLGFFTGWPTIVATLLIAILASGIFSLLYIVVMTIIRRYRSFSAIPYTPFLILAAIASYYIF